MSSPSASLLVLTVFVVGVLHTVVPDHWAPIALLARRRGWTRAQTARAAAVAGTGHVLSTLAIGLLVWVAGTVLAARFANEVSVLSSVALIVFGSWIAIGSWRELRQQRDHLGHSLHGHSHLHRHADGTEHRHWHDHHDHDWHEVADGAEPPLHDHGHETTSRTALLLILGSSPMVEGIPAFFAASRHGPGLLGLMAIVFSVSTISTYVVLCVGAAAGIERLDLGPFERYGEVLSGAFVAVIGTVFALWPRL